MGSLASLDDLVNKSTGGNNGTPQTIWFHKWGLVAGTAITFLQNRYASLWTFDGQPSGGSAPGSVAAPNNDTIGGLRQTDPGGGRQKWMTSFQNWLSSGQGSVLLYDRLLHVSGLSGTLTTAQPVGGGITRYTGSESWNNEIWYEIYSPIGSTATTITASYTDQDGNLATSVATTIGGTNHSGQTRAEPLKLAAGDTGVRGVASVTLAASTGTAGDFGITILRPIAELNFLQVGGGGLISYLELVPEIKTDACLALMYTPHSTARLGIGCAISMIEA